MLPLVVNHQVHKSSCSLCHSQFNTRRLETPSLQDPTQFTKRRLQCYDCFKSAFPAPSPSPPNLPTVTHCSLILLSSLRSCKPLHPSLSSPIFPRPPSLIQQPKTARIQLSFSLISFVRMISISERRNTSLMISSSGKLVVPRRSMASTVIIP